MSAASATNDSPAMTLRRFLRRGWWALVLGIVLGLLLAYAVAQARTPAYQSVATVAVADDLVSGSGAVANGRTTTGVNLDTEANLVTSTPVLTRVRDTLKTKDAVTAIAKRISVTVPPNSSLMNIAYQTTTKQAAQAGAAAVANAYLADRKATETSLLSAQIKLIRTNISTATASLKSVTKTAAKYKSDSAEGMYYGQQVNLLNKQISTYNTALSTAQSTVVDPGSVAGTPTLPTGAAGPSKLVYLACGLGLGLLLGLLGAWLVARRLTRTLRRPSEVEQAIGLPVIARIGGLQYGQIAPASDPAAEPYRRLVNVVNATVATSGRVVVVAGSDGSQMASTVTHNMAATLARSGERVAVLQTVGNPAEPNSVEPNSAEPNSAEPNTAGARAAGGDAAYQILPSSGPRTRTAIAELREAPDAFVLIDAPEPLKTADAQSYGATADAVVIVLRDGTSTSHAQRILAEFDAVSAPVLGVVLVKVGRAGRTSPATLPSATLPSASLPSATLPPATAHSGLGATAIGHHGTAETARPTGSGATDSDATGPGIGTTADGAASDASGADGYGRDGLFEAGAVDADGSAGGPLVAATRDRPSSASTPGSRRTVRNVGRMRSRANRD